MQQVIKVQQAQVVDKVQKVTKVLKVHQHPAMLQVVQRVIKDKRVQQVHKGGLGSPHPPGWGLALQIRTVNKTEETHTGPAPRTNAPRIRTVLRSHAYVLSFRLYTQCT